MKMKGLYLTKQEQRICGEKKEEKKKSNLERLHFARKWVAYNDSNRGLYTATASV